MAGDSFSASTVASAASLFNAERRLDGARESRKLPLSLSLCLLWIGTLGVCPEAAVGDRPSSFLFSFTESLEEGPEEELRERSFLGARERHCQRRRRRSMRNFRRGRRDIPGNTGRRKLQPAPALCSSKLSSRSSVLSVPQGDAIDCLYLSSLST